MKSTTKTIEKHFDSNGKLIKEIVTEYTYETDSNRFLDGVPYVPNTYPGIPPTINPFPMYPMITN